MNWNGLKIGVFGGAFDPPHKAHVALAQTAQAVLSLDRLHIVPTGQAWHKARTLSSAEHRLAMTRLAFQEMPNVVVDDREIKRVGPTFTIDTLQALNLENPDCELFLLMGSDQFAAFKQWHAWQKIIEIATLCVATRPRYNRAGQGSDEFKQPQMRTLTLDMPQMATSATQIRQQLAGGLGENCAGIDLMPPSVASYVLKHQLYKIS